MGSRISGFTNDNKDPVDLFLDATSCKCTEVQLFLPSKQWIERWMTLRRVGITLSEATQPLSALGMAFVVDQSPWVPFLGATKELGDGIKMKKGGLTGATIPAGQSGWGPPGLEWQPAGINRPGCAPGEPVHALSRRLPL